MLLYASSAAANCARRRVSRHSDLLLNDAAIFFTGRKRVQLPCTIENLSGYSYAGHSYAGYSYAGYSYNA
jgi:hypothetical protein